MSIKSIIFHSLPYGFTLFCLLITQSILAQQKPVVKVDLNETSRRVAETNEVGYSSWQVKAGTSDSFKQGDIKIMFTKVGEGSGELASEWYKAGMGSPNFAYLVSDGLTLKDGDAAGKIEMRISGLPEGKNTLLTYH